MVAFERIPETKQKNLSITDSLSLTFIMLKVTQYFLNHVRGKYHVYLGNILVHVLQGRKYTWNANMVLKSERY